MIQCNFSPTEGYAYQFIKKKNPHHIFSQPKRSLKSGVEKFAGIIKWQMQISTSEKLECGCFFFMFDEQFSSLQLVEEWNTV